MSGAVSESATDKEARLHEKEEETSDKYPGEPAALYASNTFIGGHRWVRQHALAGEGEVRNA